MVIIGLYPNSFQHLEIPPLRLLATKILPYYIPTNVGIHLLPFYPSSGDSGFAPDDWFTVDETLGDWNDIRKMTQNWRLIVDGIYNHVGLNHEIVREFFSNSEKYCHYVYAFRSGTKEVAPLSPRGGSVLKPYEINGKRWLVWQTFSKAAVDINLNDSSILMRIGKQMEMFRSVGIWGIRLDGPSYYGKDLKGTMPRYTPDSYKIARTIADMAISYGLKVNAQLDCDEDGSMYFPKELGYNIPIVDYAYSALLLYTFFSGDVQPLISHVKSISGRLVIRAPRTHDGILLRSRNLPPYVKKWLTDSLKEYDAYLRVIDSRPYEFNNSLPYLYSFIQNAGSVQHKIRLAIILTVMLPGWAYLYAPFLLSYIPEAKYTFEKDPRLLNRKPMPYSYWASFLKKHGSNNYKLLETLSILKQQFNPYEVLTNKSIYSYQNNLVIKRIGNRNERVTCVCNLNTNQSTQIPYLTKYNQHILLKERVTQTKILPYGFLVSISENS